MGAGVEPFRDRLVWDGGTGEIRDRHIRYLLIRPDTLMGLFARLDPPARDAALRALAASTTAQGRLSAQSYGDPSRLLAVIEATAPDLGWGIWRFLAADEAVHLTVANSPFAAGHGPADAPVCHAIAGMLGAVAGLVLDGPVTARETACAATGAPACRFVARRAEERETSHADT